MTPDPLLSADRERREIVPEPSIEEYKLALAHLAMRRHEWTDWCDGCRRIARLLRVDWV